MHICSTRGRWVNNHFDVLGLYYCLFTNWKWWNTTSVDVGETYLQRQYIRNWKVLTHCPLSNAYKSLKKIILDGTFCQHILHNLCESRMDACNLKSALVQVMAWCLMVPSHYQIPCWPRCIPGHITSPGHNELNVRWPPWRWPLMQCKINMIC